MTKQGIESLLDDMVEGQLRRDIIKQEWERFLESVQAQELKSAENKDLINQFSSGRWGDGEAFGRDFRLPIDEFSKNTVCDDYLSALITVHLEDEKYFSDVILSQAPVDEEHFRNYGKKDVCQSGHGLNDGMYILEYPLASDFFINHGIFEDIYTKHSYFDENLLDYSDDFDKSDEFVDIVNAPDIDIEEPPEDNFNYLIEDKLIEEKYMDKIFDEVIKNEDYFEKIINEKIDKLSQS